MSKEDFQPFLSFEETSRTTRISKGDERCQGENGFKEETWEHDISRFGAKTIPAGVLEGNIVKYLWEDVNSQNIQPETSSEINGLIFKKLVSLQT